MSNVLDSLFENLKDTFESNIKNIKTAGESANRIADHVGELVLSFDEQEVCIHIFL
jgi:hypothetical protein